MRQTVHGEFARRDFTLLECPDCEFVYVGDPLSNLAALYDDAYYQGRGADPLVDYDYELSSPAETVRRFEWAGVLEWGTALLGGSTEGKRWLDLGCGSGGLVRYLREHRVDAMGSDTGSYVSKAVAAGIPVIPAGELSPNSFDIISMIEVIEHEADPVGLLKHAVSLLKPGGRLFLTTGNVAPHRQRLDRWPYVRPEIHVSFFSPASLARAMSSAGLTPEPGTFASWWAPIMAFKIAKNLRLRRAHWWMAFIPWYPVAWLVDRKYQLALLPTGRLLQAGERN